MLKSAPPHQHFFPNSLKRSKKSQPSHMPILHPVNLVMNLFVLSFINEKEVQENKSNSIRLLKIHKNTFNNASKKN